VVFPELGIRQALPPRETVVVRLPSLGPRQVSFSCGMGTYRGMIVLR